MTDPAGMDPKTVADDVGRRVFGVEPTPEAWRRASIQYLVAAAECAVVIPLLFEWRFREVGELGWGTTVFFVVYCLLASIAYFFRPRTEFHTKVRLKGDWIDKLGAWWLVACAFGPLFGWICTSVLPLNEGSWRLVLGLRVFFAAVLPLLTALALTRYARGKAAWVSIPLLIGVTLLPVSTAMHSAQDLRDGVQQEMVPSGTVVTYLAHSRLSVSTR